ncbi:MAG: di-trans,poly-cis-decaprenylcistransferase, partial [Rikenellaceae bacterium]|nr:di-trans,poly-cis-decaprenylcistransferase [Rikenellaceae bacterium]
MTRFEKIPQHVAIIMDGNGRWAKAHGKERVYGHIHGVESVRRVIKACPKYGIKYLTLYTFSTENWGRPSEEVNALMELMCSSIANETPELCAQGVAVKILGDRSALSDKVNASIDAIERQTAAGQTLTLMLAFNYS